MFLLSLIHSQQTRKYVADIYFPEGSLGLSAGKLLSLFDGLIGRGTKHLVKLLATRRAGAGRVNFERGDLRQTVGSHSDHAVTGHAFYFLLLELLAKLGKPPGNLLYREKKSAQVGSKQVFPTPLQIYIALQRG